MDKQNEYYQICNDQWQLLSKNLRPESTDVYWSTLLATVSDLFKKHNKTEYVKKILVATLDEIYQLERSGKMGERQHYLMVCKDQWELMKQFSSPDNPSDAPARIEMEVTELRKKYKGDSFALEVIQVSRQELERIQLENKTLKEPDNANLNAVKDAEHNQKKMHIKR